MPHTIREQKIADILGIISIVLVFGMILISTTLHEAPPVWVCKTTAYAAIAFSLMSYIIVPKNSKDVAWTAYSTMSLFAGIAYLLLTA